MKFRFVHISQGFDGFPDAREEYIEEIYDVENYTVSIPTTTALKNAAANPGKTFKSAGGSMSLEEYITRIE